MLACRELAAGEAAAFRLAERAEFEHRHPRRGQGRAQSRGRSSRAITEPEQHARRHAPAHEGADELDRRGVAPVQVVEDEHERIAFGDQRQEPAHGAMGAMALVTERRRGRPLRARSDGRTPAASDMGSESQPARDANSCEAT